MEPLLATDRSMGRLAKWLRLLGYDTLFDPDLEDQDFLALADEGRVLITRTRALFGKLSPKKMVCVTSGDPMAQLSTVVKQLGLKPDTDKAFGRCIRCNVKVQPVDRNLVADRVPDYIFATHQEFAECPDCNRVYWPGSHMRRGMAMLGEIM